MRPRYEGVHVARERMSPTDAYWLHMERPDNRMVVTCAFWTDAPADWEAVTEALASRVVAAFPRFRQRVLDPAVTVGVVAPVWEDVEEFDLADHLRRAELPGDGDDALHEYVSSVAGAPLDPGRPLWELHLLDGYGSGSALVLRLAHALGDGRAIVQVLLAATDPVEGERHADAADFVDPVADDVSTPGAQVRSAARAGLRTAGTLARMAGDGARALSSADARRNVGRLARQIAGPVDRGPLVGTLQQDKRFSWAGPVPLDAARSSARAAGVTLNDLMLGVITSALRRQALDHGAEPQEVGAVLPVDLRTPGAPLPRSLGNAFGLGFVRLPVDEPEPVARLALLHARTGDVKRRGEGAYTATWMEMLGRGPAPAQRALIDALGRRASVVVTNIVGPRAAVALGGTPLAGALLWVPTSGPISLGVSVVSYAGQLSLGICADAVVVPDADALTALLTEELQAAG